jgi:signal transduction histidine kinase
VDRISLSARRDGDRAAITVSDGGPGFPTEHRAELFTAYRSRTGSSGLGLSVCKSIVEVHGGTITIDDSAPGGAVRFTVPFA